jgi:hypothetical protein
MEELTMSIEDARNFVDTAAGDENLRQEMRNRWGEVENVGSERGYHFNRDEFKQAMHERVGDGAGGPDPAEDPDTCTCF